MDLRPDMSIGDRLAVARRYAELTQEQLAENAGINVDTIRKLEQNQRQSCRISTANALAHALGIDTTLLLLGGVGEETREDPQVAAIRAALVPAATFAPSIDDNAEDTPPDVELLRESVLDGWSLYQSGDFTSLMPLLPGLINEARVSAHEHDGAAGEAELAKALQLGAYTMVQKQMEDLALLGLDRAAEAARRSNEPLLPAMVSSGVTWVFMRTGRLRDSERVAVGVADGIEPTFRHSPPNHVAVYGGLLLSALIAAARDRRYDDARELLTVARAAAHRIGDDSTDRWTTVFGPTTVAIQAVAVETAAGEWGKALQLARAVPLSGNIPTLWKARFLLDVAHAQAETYRDAAAVETLRTVRRLTPQWGRRHGLAKAIVADLRDRPHRPRGVLALADFFGVPY